VNALVAEIIDMLNRGERIYLHCRYPGPFLFEKPWSLTLIVCALDRSGGHGRTGTIASLLLGMHSRSCMKSMYGGLRPAD
jgi:hypothetical protein